MSNKHMLYKKVVDNSINTLNLTIRYLEDQKYNKAIDSYNILLKGFETIKELDIAFKESKFNEILIDIEELHKKIVTKFEREKWDGVNSLVIKIKEYYNHMRNFINDYLHNLSLGLNINYLQYHSLKEAGLIGSIDNKDTEVVQKYWHKYLGVEVDQSLHHAFKTLTGRLEPRLIPQVDFNRYIFPLLNYSYVSNYYDDKNTYDILMEGFRQPETILKRVRGNYFNGENKPIIREKAFGLLFETKEDIIVKQSYSNDGIAVKKLKYKNHKFYLDNKDVGLLEIEKMMGRDFIIQRVLKQSEKVAKPHRYSVNTLRMVTLRWKGKVHYLCGHIKFGSDGSVFDNTAASGGIAVSVSKHGVFENVGYDSNMDSYKKHPTTNFEFNSLEPIENYSEFINFVKSAHNRILHSDYISWDIAVSENEKPVFIEMNFRGPIYRYQLINKCSIFGDLTEEILIEAKKYKEELKNN